MSNHLQRRMTMKGYWTIRQLMQEPDGMSYSWYIAMIKFGLINAIKVGTMWLITDKEKKRINKNPPKLNRKRYLG